MSSACPHDDTDLGPDGCLVCTSCGCVVEEPSLVIGGAGDCEDYKPVSSTIRRHPITRNQMRNPQYRRCKDTLTRILCNHGNMNKEMAYDLFARVFVQPDVLHLHALKKELVAAACAYLSIETRASGKLPGKKQFLRLVGMANLPVFHRMVERVRCEEGRPRPVLVYNLNDLLTSMGHRCHLDPDVTTRALQLLNNLRHMDTASILDTCDKSNAAAILLFCSAVSLGAPGEAGGSVDSLKTFLTNINSHCGLELSVSSVYNLFSKVIVLLSKLTSVPVPFFHLKQKSSLPALLSIVCQRVIPPSFCPSKGDEYEEIQPKEEELREFRDMLNDWQATNEELFRKKPYLFNSSDCEDPDLADDFEMESLIC